MTSEPQPPKDPSGSSYRQEFWMGWRHLWDASATDWTAIDADTADSKGPCKGDAFAAVWQVIRREFPQLIRPTPAEGDELWRIATVRTLISQVQAAAPSEQRFVAQRRVAEVLDAGNRLGRWRIPIPDIPAPLPPAPRSPFQHTSFAQMVHFEPLVEQTLAAFAEAPPADDPQAYWGRLFLSALLFGALLRPAWLWALPSALEQPPGHCLWMELHDTPKDKRAPQHMRWYPDPLTRLNLVRARADKNRPEPPRCQAHSGPNVYRCIRAFARTAHIADALPKNWSQLVSVAQTRFALYLPAYLLGHAGGANTATSWPASVQQRLHTHRHAIDCNPPRLAPKTKERPADSVAPSEAGAEAVDKSAESEAAPAALRELASRIRQNDPPDPELIEAWIAEYRQTPQPLKSIERIGEWVAKSLCRKPKKGRRRLRGRTVYALYNAAAARLVGQLADTDPAAFACSDDFIEIYTTALDDTANASTRKTLARALERFHTHLVAFHNAPKEPLEVLRTPRLAQKGRHTPNANFIDEASFTRAIEWIDFRYAQTPQRGTLLVLLASLG
ncbi:site-specific integrase, partial [Halorhodospira sp. M39old]|nr:site-specific integrase [Halorhodospira sp. M39old]